MRKITAFVTCLLVSGHVFAQAALQPAQTTPPTLDEVRKGMAIPSKGDVRGQLDATGYASRPEQMAKVWELSATPPAPERLGEVPAPGVAGVICPHDDYILAGRVYRKTLPLVTARTVVLVGVFHRYRRFGAHDVLVFDTYRAWRAPDGEVPVSPLREELLAQLPRGDYVRDTAAHDSEHSLEALVYWLKHARPDVDIVPVIVPAMGFPRMEELAGRLGAALAQSMKKHGWQLGKDVAVVISSDAVHYGSDFKYTPYGEGGVDAYLKAWDRDRMLIRDALAGPVTTAKAERFFSTCVNPEQPNEYKLTWCGRFSIPMGLLVLQRATAALGLPAPVAHPLCYAISVGVPELPVRDVGLGPTAPSNLYHFVGHPSVAFTVGER
jgi:MEMO1 family protein